MRPTDVQIAAALAHAAECEPREACGVIAGGVYVRLRNVETGFDQFALDMREFHTVAKQHPVEAVVHSHVNCGPAASEADHAACERIGLPFVILSWPGGRVTVIDPKGWRAPLVGRQWVWGALDCFTLVQDAMQQFAGITLPDYPRAWGFWERDEDLIGEAVAGSGFVALPKDTAPQHLDVLGMRFPGVRVAHHLGVYLAPDRVLHQFAGRLSVREQYSGPYQRATVLHLRHERLLARAPA